MTSCFDEMSKQPSAPMIASTYDIMPPQYYPSSWDEHKRMEFNNICNQYEIDAYYAQELRTIICAPVKVIFIDNSGSMNQCIKGTTTLTRRYDELIEFMKIAVALMSIDTPDGLTFVFLNPPYAGSPQNVFPGIHAWSQIANVFTQTPAGGTPLVSRLREHMDKLDDTITEQGVLFFIATDGEPTEGAKALSHIIMKRPKPRKFIVNFLVCTDNDKEVAYLDVLDRKAICVDVTDDYRTESKQIKKGLRFTYGDYIVKAIVGGACPKFDLMDEPKRRCTIS